MKHADVQAYKERLLALRARLRGDVSDMADGALNSSRAEAIGDLSRMPIHMADLGTDNFEREFTLSLMESEEDTLGRIEASLERIVATSALICSSARECHHSWKLAFSGETQAMLAGIAIAPAFMAQMIEIDKFSSASTFSESAT